MNCSELFFCVQPKHKKIIITTWKNAYNIVILWSVNISYPWIYQIDHILFTIKFISTIIWDIYLSIYLKLHCVAYESQTFMHFSTVGIIYLWVSSLLSAKNAYCCSFLKEQELYFYLQWCRVIHFKFALQSLFLCLYIQKITFTLNAELEHKLFEVY